MFFYLNYIKKNDNHNKISCKTLLKNSCIEEIFNESKNDIQIMSISENENPSKNTLNSKKHRHCHLLSSKKKR